MMNRHVVVIANPVVDILFPIEGFPILPGRHQNVADRLITPGGQATTLLLGARLGLNMQVLGTTGDDEMGRLWLRRVAAEGVDVEQVISRDNWPTSVSVVLADATGQHVFLAASAGEGSGPSELPPPWLAAIKRAAVVTLDGWSLRSMGPEPNLLAIRAAKMAGIPIFFDPGPQIDADSRPWMESVLAGINVALLTSEEAQKFAPHLAEPAALAEHIRQMGPELVLLKLGADGIMAHTAEETLTLPAFTVPVRDTTGAGDSVMAAAVHAYLAGYSLEKMAILANATGAACVQKLGAGINAPQFAEVMAVLQGADVPFVL